MTAISSLYKFDSTKLAGFVCSGEEDWHYMRGTQRGSRLTCFTWSDCAEYRPRPRPRRHRARRFPPRLCMPRPSAPARPSSRPASSSGDPAPYSILRHGAERGLEMFKFVANPPPDLRLLAVTVLPDGTHSRMPGASARATSARDAATWFGKPRRR